MRNYTCVTSHKEKKFSNQQPLSVFLLFNFSTEWTDTVLFLWRKQHTVHFLTQRISISLELHHLQLDGWTKNRAQSWWRCSISPLHIWSHSCHFFLIKQDIEVAFMCHVSYSGYECPFSLKLPCYTSGSFHNSIAFGNLCSTYTLKWPFNSVQNSDFKRYFECFQPWHAVLYQLHFLHLQTDTSTAYRACTSLYTALCASSWANIPAAFSAFIKKKLIQLHTMLVLTPE